MLVVSSIVRLKFEPEGAQKPPWGTFEITPRIWDGGRQYLSFKVKGQRRVGPGPTLNSHSGECPPVTCLRQALCP